MIKIGIICPSEIALRRFLPALNELSVFKYVGVAIANENEWEGTTKEILDNEKHKAGSFKNSYGGKIFDGYASLIKSDEIDAVYLPLPPALHYKWARLSIEYNKHVLIEKPATISLEQTQNLISFASQNEIAIHENYMFEFHNQIFELNEIIKSGKIGEVRLFRISFGFPQRDANDFRYNKQLGGGAIIDCGGYTLKYASILLGKTAKLVTAKSNFIKEFDVDIFGSATLVNDEGITAQVSFGMDNSYKCDLEVWGSFGHLHSKRVLTAPPDYIPEVQILTSNGVENIKLSSDNAFKKSLLEFYNCIQDSQSRKYRYNAILRQARLVDKFIKNSKYIL